MMKITIEAAFDDPLKAAVFFSHMTTCSRELGDAPTAKPAAKLAAAVEQVAPPVVTVSLPTPVHAEPPLIEGPMPGEPTRAKRGRPSKADLEARAAAAEKSNSLARVQTAVATAKPLPEKSEPAAEPPLPLETQAPAADPAPAGELSLDELHTFARDAMVKRLVDPNDTRKLLDEFGAATLSVIPPSRRAEFLERFKGIMKKAA